MEEIKLGSEVKDKVSGYQGIATSRVAYLNGLVSYGVTGKVTEPSKYPDTHYIDRSELEVVGPGINL